MSDKTIQTTRFGLQQIGDGSVRAAGVVTAGKGAGNTVIEPADYNQLLASVDAQVCEVPHLAADFTLGAGVAFTWERPQGNRLLRLTLTNVVLTLAGATTSCVASLAILTWPATSNLGIECARMNLTTIKDGAILLTSDQPLVGVGSVAASVSTLATTTIDTINAVTLATGLTPPCQGTLPAVTGRRYVAKGATNKLFLNVGISTKVGGTLTVSGTIDIFYDEYGNFSSVTA